MPGKTHTCPAGSERVNQHEFFPTDIIAGDHYLFQFSPNSLLKILKTVMYVLIYVAARNVQSPISRSLSLAHFYREEAGSKVIDRTTAAKEPIGVRVQFVL